MATATGAVSDPEILALARRLRAASGTLEAIVFLVVAGSVAAFGSVHSWAYVPLWFACLGTGSLLAYRTFLARSLRQRLGRARFTLHATDRWINLEGEPSYGLAGWSFDLGRPFLPTPPLLLPGVVFLGWVLFQLLPLPPAFVDVLSLGHPRPALASADRMEWRPLTFSVDDTLRGLAFLAAALLLHFTAAAVFETQEARERFRRALAGLGLGLALVALAQFASGTHRIYGLFRPVEWDGYIFGPFVNRNHFAGYMLMVAPMTFALLARASRHYARRVGERPNVRRRLVVLSSSEGIALMYATMPALATVAALVATRSRGGLLAFGGSFGLAAMALRRRGAIPTWVPMLGLICVALSWFGVERLGERFGRAPGDATGRIAIWNESLHRMEGLWLTGSGLNTFALAVSRSGPWTLPVGATPWPGVFEDALTTGAQPGFRTPASLHGLTWYREAHNDYIQVLVETGIPGLALGIFGTFAVLKVARRDPWLLAAVAGVLMHVIVDFDLQIPANAVLFVALAAMR